MTSPRARRPPWLRGALLTGLALAPSGGCDDARPPFSIEIVDPAGENPVRDTTSGRLRVAVAQLGQPTRETGVELVNGTFQLDVSIADYTLPTRVHVELERDGVTSFGAVPNFAPFFLPFVRVPVVPASSCAGLEGWSLTSARSAASMLVADTHLLVVGGLDTSSARASRAERFTPQLLTSDAGAISTVTLEPALGRADAARLGESGTVVVVAEAGVFTLDLGESALDPSALEGVHEGAGARTALATLGELGVALVGGEGSADVSWIDASRGVTRSALPDRREAAAAGAWGEGEGVVVAGGRGEGDAPSFLFVPSDEAARAIVTSFDADALAGSPREGGWLARSPSGDALLWVGMRDEGGATLDETWILTGCPAACAAREGPRWPSPRAGARYTETAAGGWLLGGASEDGAPIDAVERIEWSGTTPRFVPTHLAVARADVAAAPLEGGLVLVAGGRGESGARDDLELCAPSALEAF